MTKKEITRVVSERFIKMLDTETLDPKEQFNQAVAIALSIEEGKVYQKIGKDHLKLKMRHIGPAPLFKDRPEAWEEKRPLEEFKFTIEKELAEEKKDLWFKRVLGLMLKAKNLNLHTKNDDGEFVKMKIV